MRNSFPAAVLAALLLAACGGGGGSATNTPAPPAVTVQVSAASNLAASCGAATSGASGEIFTPDSAVQPQVATNPALPGQVFGVWEQDRWNAIGARAIDFSSSTDGGATWKAPAALPFSRCGGGSGAGAGFDRASDPSISVGMSNTVYASALAFSAAGFFAAGGTSAVLVSRSTDGGATWQAPVTVASDSGVAPGPYYFNDRDAIAADPASANVYLVWDRINTTAGLSPGGVSEPTLLAHSGDGGQTWDTARIIYDPGLNAFTAQSFNNQPLVLPNGSVVVLFTLISGFNVNLTAIRSTDHGTTWSGAINIAAMSSLGTANPAGGTAPPIRDSANMAQTAVDPAAGTLAAVWQESSFSGNLRDGIALVLSHDGGATWTAPVQVNTATGVAAFSPSVHFGSGGRIAVTYYDFRDYVAGSAALGTSLWLRESADGGTTWTEKRLFGPFDLNKAPPADQAAGSTGNALFLGDQQGLAWNGSQWTGLFSATVPGGARVFSAVSP